MTMNARKKTIKIDAEKWLAMAEIFKVLNEAGILKEMFKDVLERERKKKSDVQDT